MFLLESYNEVKYFFLIGTSKAMCTNLHLAVRLNTVGARYKFSMKLLQIHYKYNLFLQFWYSIVGKVKMISVLVL